MSNEFDISPNMLTTKDVMKLTGLSRSKLKTLRNNRKLTYYDYNKNNNRQPLIRYDIKDIFNFIKSKGEVIYISCSSGGKIPFSYQ